MPDSHPHKSRSGLADELRAVMEADDGRTLVEMREAEPHYDIVVETAEYDGEGTSISFDNGTCTYLAGRAVEVGDIVTIWDGQTKALLGSERHGWAHNGELIEWLTPFERIAKRAKWLADYDRRQRTKLEEGAERRARDYDSLPAPLKARLDRFATKKADFWKDGGDYELFCCIEANKIGQVGHGCRS